VALEFELPGLVIVVGPAFGLALVSALVYWIRRNRRPDDD
jgi:hypothetical protein